MRSEKARRDGFRTGVRLPSSPPQNHRKIGGFFIFMRSFAAVFTDSLPRMRRANKVRRRPVSASSVFVRALPAKPVAPRKEDDSFCCYLYHVSENSTSSGVSGLPMSGSFLSSAESRPISSAYSVKSNRVKFSLMCAGLVLLGMTTMPFCVRKRSRICAGVLPYFSARASTADSANISLRLP